MSASSPALTKCGGHWQTSAAIRRVLAEHADKGSVFYTLYTIVILMSKNVIAQIAQRRGHVLSAYEELQDIACHLDKLGAEGMSGDESDHADGRRRYVVRKLNWRSDEVTKVMRVLDALVLVSHWTRDGRPRAGKFPHMCIDSDRVDNKDPVCNLPHNFYRPEWLETLDKYERRRLNMLALVPLNIPSKILRYVASSSDIYIYS